MRLLSNKHLYPCFQHWPGTVWFYSDPHFNDDHLKQYRNNITAEEQVKRINSKVGKNGTIVFLGDIGDLEFVKKLKGYKVLIMGNHEKGASNYMKNDDNKLFDEVYDGTLQIASNIILSHEPVDYQYCLNIHGHDHAGADFKKYVTKTSIAQTAPDKMIDKYLEAIKSNKLKRLNVCAECINYTPINIEKIIKSGILHSITDVHRETIDGATLRKLSKTKR